MNSKKLLETLRSLAVITVGSAIFAVAFVWLYQPNSIASGGLTGLAQIVNHLVPAIPVGVTVIGVTAVGITAVGITAVVARRSSGRASGKEQCQRKQPKNELDFCSHGIVSFRL
jgi:ABC-type phosphate/phosphonate transport system permease subunit